MATQFMSRAGERPARGMLTPTRIGLTACVLALALALVSGARGDVVGAPLTLGSITIEDGTAVLSGAVDDVDALLEVNGVPVDIDDAGNFLTVVSLDGNAIVLELAENLGETTTIRIPIAALIENGGEGILNDLLDAAPRSTSRSTGSRSSTRTARSSAATS